MESTEYSPNDVVMLLEQEILQGYADGNFLEVNNNYIIVNLVAVTPSLKHIQSLLKKEDVDFFAKYTYKNGNNEYDCSFKVSGPIKFYWKIGVTVPTVQLIIYGNVVVDVVCINKGYKDRNGEITNI